jgi:predicted PurR-regulated permease PerM
MSKPPTPRLPAGERLRRAGIAAWSIIGLLVLVAIFVWLLFKIRVIFPPLVLALLIIYLLNPVVSRLQARGVPRTIGALIAYLIVAVALVVFGLLVAPLIARQVDSFGDQLPELRLDFVRSIEGLGESIETRFNIEIDTSQVVCLFGAEEIEGPDRPTQAECDEVTRRYREQILQQADRITEFGTGLLELLLIFILGPLLALYLLIDLPQLQRDLLNLVPENNRDEFSDLGTKIGRAVGGFFRGQLLVALLVGVLSSIGFAIVGLDFWLVIGAIAGFTNLIPLVGPFIGGGLGFVVGTITDGVSTGLYAVLVAVIVQQIDNHIVSPNVMKRTVKLHPVTVMLSLLAGGTLAGFWGVLLAVPAVAVAKLLLGHVWATRVLGSPPSPYSPGTAGEAPSVVPED